MFLLKGPILINLKVGTPAGEGGRNSDLKEIFLTRGINDFMLLVSASLPASGWGSSGT